ncbi:MAG: tRNA (5-methylaminomethyl-2-thiouridine)(34)-methyltransferase MnmD [Candidatus Omnitrophica bacterium]|nr:tRNA (5-methylaminomethyl-2-thiouridine)(34)-methyltransferase MnmD [Candidatus Omnitrophota bacterium]
MALKVIQTADGSSSLFHEGFQDHYHSIHGALQESTHVFIRQGLDHISKKNISLLEVGFGTGLNAYLTAVYAGEKRVHYTAIEKFPLADDTLHELNFPRLSGLKEHQDLFFRLHRASWDRDVDLQVHFTIRKVFADVTRYCFDRMFDLVYFDAFAPEKQPDMWGQRIFEKIFAAMHPGGILVTYTSKGTVKRILQACGFIVEKIPGPPGKRHMLRAVKNI